MTDLVLTLCHRDAEVISTSATVDTEVNLSTTMLLFGGSVFFGPWIDSFALPILLTGNVVTGTHRSDDRWRS